jgi:hypothetical protein
LVAHADPATLAMAVMASVQGGLLLTKTRKTSHPLRVALDAAMVYLRSFAAPDPATGPPTRRGRASLRLRQVGKHDGTGC